MVGVELSVVIPVYGCEECLRALHRRLTESVRPLVGSYEIVYVDDRSPDGSWQTLREIAAADPAVRLVRLSRNFGQHPAITAGLAQTTGEWVVVMDCDLEDPPEEIPRLYEKAKEGFEVVMCRRALRRQSLVRRQSARIYRRLANFLARSDVDPDYTNLSIVSRSVVNDFLRFRDQDRQYLLILLWLGFNHATIDVEQDSRYAGRSSYTLRELVRVAADGIFFQSTKLLRWIVYAGFMVAALGGVLAVLVVYNYVQQQPPAGWTSLSVLVLILGGFIIASTGVMGLYIGKIFGQVKGRPLYVVDSRVVDGSEVSQEAGAPAAGESRTWHQSPAESSDRPSRPREEGAPAGR